MDGDSRRDVGTAYRSVRLRLTALLRETTTADPAAWDAPVAACPGWAVRDVLAHLVGNLEDGRDGKLSGSPGPPGPSLTADQVARHRPADPAELLAVWPLLAEPAEERFGGGPWPVFLDAVSHEHDVRAALGRRDQRDHPDVRLAARVLASSWGAGEPGLWLSLDSGAPTLVLDGPDALTLRTDSFTWLRLRMGRRTPEEVRALDWSGDPGALLDRLFVFGPAVTSIGE